VFDDRVVPTLPISAGTLDSRGVALTFTKFVGDEGVPSSNNSTVRLYYLGASSQPAAPTATITWATGAVTIHTSGRSLTGHTINASGASITWTSDVTFLRPTPSINATTGLYTVAGTTGPVTGSTPVRHINFDGIVTFTNGSSDISSQLDTLLPGAVGNLTSDQTLITNIINAVNNSNTTTIDGGNITGNTITVNQLILANQSGDGSTILESDGAGGLRIKAASITHHELKDDSVDSNHLTAGAIETAPSQKVLVVNSG
jgi:hypothetical protein